MKKLVFATNNRHKVEEVQAALLAAQLEDFEVLTLGDCAIVEEIPEEAPTLEGNALFKAQFVRERLAQQGRADHWVFADDTGLEVTALSGAPGVHSARYSGGESDQNIEKLLREMTGAENRTAQFRTAIALLDPQGVEHLFEGVVRGEILTSREDGAQGFGYDPVFRPAGHSVSFANMSMGAKNAISHRGRALLAMVKFLQS